MQKISSQSQNDLQIKNKEETSEIEMMQTKLGPRDLRVLGKLWIFLIRAILIGAKTCLIPTVKAAPPPKEPQRPPKMKYTDLPLYDCPHVLYKEHTCDKIKCPDEKIFHKMLHPHVSAYREQVSSTLCMLKSELSSTYTEVVDGFGTAEQNIKSYMRGPDNETLRRVVMAVGTAAGYYIGSGGALPKRIFCTGMGACAVGSICYPKQTDEAFRTFLATAGKGMLYAINKFCGKGLSFGPQVPCARDVPEIPPPLKKFNCPPKK